MKTNHSRRSFLGTGMALAGIGLGFRIPSLIAQEGAKPAPSPLDKGPRLDLEMVQQFVIAGHGNLEKVKELLTKQPALINATWDWGSGDWETALGGAAHMGRRDIALYLLEHKARLDLFAAAMLGKLDIVRAALAAFPDALKVPGPHGIPLVAHAKAGGAEAVAVFDYLGSFRSA